MNKKHFSKYRECQECKKKFVLPVTTLTVESQNKYFEVFCIRCGSTNTAQISKKLYNQR